jgi:palmitoyl-protein thioesterase
MMILMRELISEGAYIPWIQDLITPAQYWHDPLNNTAFLEVPY